MRWPSSRISPSYSASSPTIRRSKVDLPQPLAPTMLTNSPGRTSRLMLCNTGSGLPSIR
eukprot:gene12767-14979_t